MKGERRRKLALGFCLCLAVAAFLFIGLFVGLTGSSGNPSTTLRNQLVLYDDTVQPLAPDDSWTDVTFDVTALRNRRCWRHTTGGAVLEARCTDAFVATLSVHYEVQDAEVTLLAGPCTPTTEPCLNTSECCQTYPTAEVCNSGSQTCVGCGPPFGGSCQVDDDCCNPLTLEYCCRPDLGMLSCVPNQCQPCADYGLFCNGPNQTSHSPCCQPGLTCQFVAGNYFCEPPEPTPEPTAAPTGEPTTAAPTEEPTAAPTTASPTAQPSAAPTTSAPTQSPTAVPLGTPTAAPTAPTTAPTRAPTTAPTRQPTASPSALPTPLPTAAPTLQPTRQPTAPTAQPTSTTGAPLAPSPPTMAPTLGPSCLPLVQTRLVWQSGGSGPFTPLAPVQSGAAAGFQTATFVFEASPGDVFKFQARSTCPLTSLVPYPLDVQAVGYPIRPPPPTNISALLTVVGQ